MKNVTKRHEILGYAQTSYQSDLDLLAIVHKRKDKIVRYVENFLQP